MADHFETQINAIEEGGAIRRDVIIRLFLHGCEIYLIPESPRIIANVDLDAKEGYINACHGNGSFLLSWSPTNISLAVSKLGDAGGGGLSICVPATPELLSSLRTALKKWRNRY